MGEVRELAIDPTTGEPVNPMDGGIYDMSELASEYEMAKEAQAKLQEIIGASLGDQAAKYKLEVFFPQNSSRQEAYPGLVSIWSSSGAIHGGGDHNVYLCTARVDDTDGTNRTCAAPIDLRFINNEMAVCPTCKSVVDPAELCGQIFARLTTTYWVRLLLKIFRRLESDADIRLTFIDNNLREATRLDQELGQKGDLINKSRRNRRFVQYCLEDIIKDTANGADLGGRIKALLTA